MLYGIEIAGVLLTQTNGVPVHWPTPRAAKEAKLDFIAALVGSMASAKLLPHVDVVELRLPITPIVDTPERVERMSRRDDVPTTYDPHAAPRGWEEVEGDEAG